MVRFIIVSIGIYSVFVVMMFTVLESPFRSLYITMNNAMFRTMWKGVQIQFSKTEPPEDSRIKHRANNVVVQITNNNITSIQGIHPGITIANSSNVLGYLPLSLFIALTIAMPLHWKRILRNLGIGLVMVWFILTFFSWFSISMLADMNNCGWWNLSVEWRERLMPFLNAILANQISISYSLPLLVWLVVHVMSKDVGTLVYQNKKKHERRTHALMMYPPKRLCLLMSCYWKFPPCQSHQKHTH